MVAFQHVAEPRLPSQHTRLPISVSWSIYISDGQDSSPPGGWGKLQMSLRASRGHTLEVHHPKGLLGQQSPRVWVDVLPSREETEVSRNLLPGAGGSEV